MYRAWIANAIAMGVEAGQNQPLGGFESAYIRSMAVFLDKNPEGTFEEYCAQERVYNDVG